MLLKGAENLAYCNITKNHGKNVMTLPLLKILGHEISITSWSTYNKQLIWTVACIAFFGSFRLGELLCGNDSSFDIHSDLVWGDVKMLDNSLLVHVKSPKSKCRGGEFVDIFAFNGHNSCPLKAFKQFVTLSELKNFKEKNRPVFVLENGRPLTKHNFNKTVNDLLVYSSSKLGAKITGHSFRAGIPAMLAKHPEISTDRHILGWGRWGYNAYLSYARLKFDQKKRIYEKIVTVLNL